MSIKDKEKLPEAFDELDFFNRSNRDEIKRTLRGFRAKLNALPADERLYELENYAVKMGLYLTKDYDSFVINGQTHRVPVNGRVVMPGYERLRNAHDWLLKLERVESVDAPRASTNLPF